MMKRRGRRTRLCAAALVALGALSACGTTLLHQPAPAELADVAHPVGFKQSVRFWGDATPDSADLKLAEKLEQTRGRYEKAIAETGEFNIALLALSGGADDGAYGAGLLAGWTAAGDRPEFEVVTGVSTGALIAPFAFLGSDYDPTLREIYTTLDSDAVFDAGFFSGLRGVLSGPALASTAPMRARIAEYVTPEIVAEIAAAHREGRRLFIGTTHLDAQRPVIWDIGEIAQSGRPDAVSLIGDVMLASASIPGVFPPVLVPVEANGRRYSELHVDGGVTSQVFLYPADFELENRTRMSTFISERDVYIIRNTKVAARYDPVDPGFLQISRRSISAMILSQGVGDVYRLYLIAQRDGLDYNLAFVPDDFQMEADGLFDPAYMSALFDLGYAKARDGYPWAKTPPGLTNGVSLGFRATTAEAR